MATLYVGFDVFEPGVFDPNATGKDGRFFVVLQPMIFVQNNAADQIALKDYFNLIGSDLFAKVGVQALTADIAAKIKAAAPGDVCPVPFPPETTVFFSKISWDGLTNPITIPGNGSARTIGGYATTTSFTSPFLLEKQNWPHFAATNNIAPRITDWDDLPDAGKQNDVLAWLAGAVGKIAHHSVKDPATLTDTEKRVLAILQGAGLANDSVLSSQAIESKLRPIAGQIYACFFTTKPPDPSYQPKQFAYSEQQLTENPLLLMALDPIPSPPKPLPNAGDILALSYHERLWNQFEFKCATGDNKAAQSVQSALGRLFGFGERLYWPRQDDESFIHYGSPDNKNWICTGPHSLLGHVFGFQLPVDKKLKNFSVDLKIQGNAIVGLPLVNSGGQIGMLEGAQNALVDWYGAVPRKKVAAGLSLDPTPNLAKGFFVYQPKTAACTEAQTPDNASKFFAVPSALLDAVDPTPRWDQPKGASGNQLTVSNSPRNGLLCSEVYGGTSLFSTPPGARAPYLRLRVTLKRTPVPYETLAAYVLTLAAPPLEREIASIAEMFAQVSHLSPELWIVKTNSSAPVSWKITPDRLLTPKLPVPDFTLVLADTDGSLAALLQPPPPPPPPATLHPSKPTMQPQTPDPSHAVCDLVLTIDVTALKDTTLFNLLKASADAPHIALNNAFLSRLNRSTDRFQERVGISLSPWAPGSIDPNDFVDKQLTNFNLLRMNMTSLDPTVVKLTPQSDPDDIYDGATVDSGKAIFPITLNDALIPLPAPAPGDASPPWKVSWPAGPILPQFGYFLSHIFTQDMHGTGGIEALRYVNYLTPEIAWTLEGDVAHQYGTFLAVADPASVILPLTTDISHPGLSVRRQINTADLSHSALMTWRMPNAPTTILQLVFPTQFLKLVVSGDSVATSDSVTRYRVIYEPLADFLLCLDNTDTDPQTAKQVAGLTLRLEGWVFDGTNAADARLNPDTSISEPPPVLINNMRMLGSAEIVLTPALLASQAPNAPQLQQLRDTLGHPFGDFIAGIGATAASSAPDWATLNVPLGGWTLDASRLDPASLYAQSDLVRVGLELVRPSAAVPPPLPAPPAMLPGFAMAPSVDAAKYFPGDFSDLKDNASAELWRYVTIPVPPAQVSALRKRFAWLRPRDGGLGTTLASGLSQSNSPATLVGDVAPFVSWHPDAASAIDTVLTMYYVPIAFQPLKAHPMVGDPGAVEDFVGFLLGVISDIIAGRAPAGVTLDTKYTATDIGKVYDLRADVSALYRDKGDGKPSAVSALIDLVAFVEPAYTDPGPAFSTFRKILQLAKDLENRGTDGWRRTLTVMLEQTPNLYADAQGFAVAVIDHSAPRDSWNDGLMALQVSKSIPSLSSSPGVQGKRVQDRIAFTRVHGRSTNPYFIDTFDGARYHDQFTITRNSYTPTTPGPGNPAKFSDGISLTGRGDAQARIADDFLRNRMRFDETPPAQRRTLEAEVVPYNPVWNLSNPGSLGTYLLPARAFPDQPVVMIPAASDTSPDATPPWRTEMNLTFQDGTPPNLASAYWSNLKSDVLIPSVIFSGASGNITAHDPQFPYPSAEPGEGGMPDGWWFLDTYVTHHHFRVTPDPSDGFDLDSFRIEIETSSEPFPADPQTTAVQPPVPDGGLLASYKYQRKIAQDRSGTLTAPIVKADKLTDELRQWLSVGGGETAGNLGLLRPYLDPAGMAAAVPAVNKFLYTPSPLPLGTPATLEHESSSAPIGIGDVIAVDLLQIEPTTEAWILRVIVLDQAWKCMRVRVTHLRNEGRLNGHAEFAPEFAMESPPSSWSTFGREPAIIDLTSETLLSRNLPQSVATLRPSMSASDFMNANGPVSYGNAISTARDAQFTATNGKTYAMWNPLMIADPTYTVRGTVLHERLDLHPRFRLLSGKTVSATAGDQSRKEIIPRQFLPANNTLVTADKIDQLVTGIDRGQVTGLHQKISIVWLNPKTEEVLTAIWPVLFKV